MTYASRKKYGKLIKIDGGVDYKDLRLKDYITDSGKKIIPRRVTGISAFSQRQVSKAIKVARFLALLPYCDKHSNFYKIKAL